MTRVIAIALIAVRSAVRSRLFLSLAGVLLIAVFGLPLTVKGDGTVTGQVKIMIGYTLALSTAILGAATVWTACASVAKEIEQRQIRLIAVKPVRTFQILVGKWLGLAALNAVLLCLVGVTFVALLRWNTRPSILSGEDRQALHEEILTGRRLIAPRVHPVDQQAQSALERLIREKRIPPTISRTLALREVKRRLLTQHATVVPGGARQWIFDVPARLRHAPPLTPGAADSPVSVRFRLSSAAGDEHQVAGTWNARASARTATGNGGRQSFGEDVYKFTIGGCRGAHRFPVPLSVIQPGEQLIVRFENADRDLSSTAIFGSGDGVELLIRESTFEANLLRSLIVVFCYLMLLAALGLIAGSVLSFPVATFVATSVLAVSLMSHYAVHVSILGHTHHHGLEKPEPSLLHATGERLSECVDAVVAPVLKFNPVGALSDGILVSWKSTARAAALLGFLYPACLGLIGWFFLSRRELALLA